jgi:RsiW-degrading membrane proteinase PrsW (M82 family)
MTETIPRRSRADALFFVFTLIGSLLCLGATIILTVLSVRVRPDAGPGQLPASIWGAVTFGLMFLISLLGVYRAWTGWRQGSSPPTKPRLHWAFASIILPLVVCLTSVVALREDGTGIFASLVYALSIGSVILAFVLFIRWLGPPLSARRAWGHFLIGMWVMPAISLVLELLLFIPSLLLLGLGLMLSPDGRTMIDMVSTLLTKDAWLFTDSILELSLQPWIVGLMLFNIAFLVPLLEEAIKALGILPLLRRKPTPAQGFLGGALAGAGFSLFEALFASEPGQLWLAIVIGRTGTTLMHIFTAAITNWALVRSVRDRKWGTFGLAYLGAVGLHAIWNASSVGMGLAGLVIESDPSGISTGYASVVICTGGLILLCLAGFSLIAFPWISRRLTRPGEVEV